MGLQAARAVFYTRQRAVDDQASFLGGTPLKLGGMLQHMFYASVMLVMDVCVNGQDDMGQVEEVKLALQIMEDSKHTSQLGDGFYESLLAVLRKHNVKLPNSDSTMQMNGELEVDDMWQDVVDGGTVVVDGGTVVDGRTVVVDGGTVADGGTVVDGHVQDWESLLRDLDMRIM